MSVSRTGEVQLIAANVDVLFLVSSCNEDFNLSRMERYLALAMDAGVQPVVVLTKADLTDSPEDYRDQTLTLGRDLVVELVNALDPGDLEGLRAWCQPGQTIALLGSSGVGKSTLINSLAGKLDSGYRRRSAKMTVKADTPPPTDPCICSRVAVCCWTVRECGSSVLLNWMQACRQLLMTLKVWRSGADSTTVPMIRNRAARSRPP